MLLSDLNDIQRLAVECIEKPVLIFAGAGSGKTRVLTYKIAYLLEQGRYAPENILAVTFTNKAAKEMANRVAGLVGSNHNGASTEYRQINIGPHGEFKGVQVGTFHSICARILRRDIHRLGYRRDFVIYDADDQLRLIKQVIEQGEYTVDMNKTQAIRHAISNAKNHMLTADDMAASATSQDARLYAAIFADYQTALMRNHALDFDDLLLKPLELFKDYPEVLAKYQDQFKYILVDEYQDTNKAQFELVRQLADKHQNICVVGDDDQSIYSWRGADITNILNFSSIFKDAQVFKLEQNYRSTAVILEAANAVVKHNKSRTEKLLWTENGKGSLIDVIVTQDEREEAERIWNAIQHEVLVNKRRFKDMVILYRTNAQSRVIEDELRRRSITYKIVGGTKFYDRKEVKDVLAYLKLLINPSDSVSLERIVNFPPRAIGDTSLTRLRAFAVSEKLEIFEALEHGREAGAQPKQAQAMIDFKALITRYRAMAADPAEREELVSTTVGDEAVGNIQTRSEYTLAELVTSLLDDTGLLDYYVKQESVDARERLANMKEVVNSVSSFEEDNPGALLRDFLEEISLLTDIDRLNEDTNAVTLMTLHAVKGLEYPVVFMTGLEEGLFPLYRADEEDGEEEERRLFYVGVTRAKEKLYISYANQRRRWGGDLMEGSISHFIRELPEELIRYVQPAKKAAAATTAASMRSTSNVTQARASIIAMNSHMDDFVVGAWVEHKIFGKGQISDREGVGDTLKLTVDFGGSRKKLVAKYANLTRL